MTRIVLPILLSACIKVAEGSDYQTCLDASGGATSLVSACMEAEYRRQNARLNQAWRKTLADLPPDRQGGLLDMQSCLIEETRRRANKLETL